MVSLGEFACEINEDEDGFMKRILTFAYCWFKSPCDLGWLEKTKIARKRL